MIRIIEWGEPVEGARMTITIAKDTFAPGELIPVTIILKNIRKENVLRVVGRPIWATYVFGLFFSDGKPVPNSLFGQRMQDPRRFFARTFREISPGAAAIATVPINRLFDMTLPDTYELFVSRPVEREDGNGFVEVTSNRIVIEVSEAVGEDIGPEQVI